MAEAPLEIYCRISAIEFVLEVMVANQGRIAADQTTLSRKPE